MKKIQITRRTICDIWKKNQQLIILLLLAVVVSVGIELLFQVPAFRESKRGNAVTTYEEEAITYSGVEWKDGKLLFTKEAGEVVLKPQGNYVEKLCYSFEVPDEKSVMNVVISVHTYDAYGNETVKTITDQNPYVLRKSVVNLRMKASEIHMQIPGGMEGAVVYDIQTRNQPGFNGMRWLFFATLLALAAVMWTKRFAFIGKVENLFLVIGLTAGTLLVLLVPLNKIGFDEEVHFRNAYNIKLSAGVSSTNEIEQLKYVTLANWPYNVAQSKEERDAMVQFYETAGDYTKDSEAAIEVPTNIESLSAFHYLFMGLGIKLGKLLQLPFTSVFTLGRMMNLWSYVFLVYFAIRRLPIGKYIMAVLALMPTPLFQAAVYSYDAMITGFVYLGVAYLIGELIEKEKKITIPEGLILLGSLGFGMVPKAVYFPLMGLPFLLPKEKFKTTAQRRIFRIANILCIWGLLVAILLPVLGIGGTVNDVRGGEVDAMAQLKLVLSQPLSYAGVWMENVSNTFWSYGFGEGSLGTLGHMAVSTCIPMIGLLLIFTIATDNVDRSDKDLTTGQKWCFFGAAVLAVAFVWGALYLSFNPVASTFIGGVQGRYFVPLLFVFYLLLRRKGIRNGMTLVNYHYLVFGGTLFIIYKTIYDCVLQPFWF